MSKLSIVVPCYNEEESIPLFYPAVEKVVRQMNELKIEYWFVNDGSADKSLEEMRKLHQQTPSASTMFLFHVTLTKKLVFMPDYRLRLGTM